MKKLFVWAKPYIIHLVILFILLAVLEYLYSFLSIFIGFALGQIGDYETSSSLPEFLSSFLLSFDSTTTVILMTGVSLVALQFIRSVMRFASNYMQGDITQNIQRDMRVKLYNHITDLSFSYHNHVDSGDLLQRCTSDVDTSSQFIASQFPTLFDIFITVIVGAYQMSKINIEMMLVSLAILPITIISSIIYFSYSTKLLDQVEKKEAEMTTDIQESVSSIRVVKAFANEDYEIKKVDKANLEYSNKNAKFIRVMALYWGGSDFLVLAQYCAAVIVGINLTRQGLISGSEMATCLLLMEMVVWPMRSLGRIVSNFGKAIVASKRIDHVLKEKSEFEINGDKKPEINGDIEFKNVSFKFDDGDESLLNDVSFKINPGQVVAIVGKTGAGKSTICNLLTRFLEIDSGSILLNGVDIRDIDKKYLRKNIKIVLQDPFLYSRSIYENLVITNKSVSRKSIIEASRIANIDDEIVKFKSGYDTYVGEKGTTLSGGQKQRLAIARILVGNTPVLIFDDSLSALDTKTDLLIRRALKKRDTNQTMIIITHRITTAKEADQIIVLDKGKIEEIGTHNELKDNNGLYSSLWGLQGKLEKEFNDILKKGDE